MLSDNDKNSLPIDAEEMRRFIESQVLTCSRAVIDSRPMGEGEPYPSSYFGGLPHLPTDVPWPSGEVRGRNQFSSYDMTFVLQINLEDLPVHNGLPTSGLLLFFVLGGDDVEAQKVIYVPVDEIPDQPRSAPENLYPCKSRLTNCPWLDQNDPSVYVDYRYRVWFDEHDTFPIYQYDGEDVDQWSRPDKVLRLVESAAEERWNAKKLSTCPYELPPPRRSRRWPRTAGLFSGLSGGPYTWKDVTLIALSYERKIRPHLEPHLTESYDPREFCDGYEQHISNVLSLSTKWQRMSDRSNPWSSFPPIERSLLMNDIEKINYDHKNFAKEIQQAKEDLTARLPPRTFVWFNFPYGLNRMNFREVIRTNIRELYTNGLNPFEFYPESVIDLLVPAPSLEPSHRYHGWVGEHFATQVGGYPRSYQELPDKDLTILQISARGFGWMDNMGCVLHFKMSETDLEQGSFESVYTLFSCD